MADTGLTARSFLATSVRPHPNAEPVDIHRMQLAKNPAKSTLFGGSPKPRDSFMRSSSRPPYNRHGRFRHLGRMGADPPRYQQERGNDRPDYSGLNGGCFDEFEIERYCDRRDRRELQR